MFTEVVNVTPYERVALLRFKHAGHELHDGRVGVHRRKWRAISLFPLAQAKTGGAHLIHNVGW